MIHSPPKSLTSTRAPLGGISDSNYNNHVFLILVKVMSGMMLLAT
jgi:hypothetical protein